MTYVRAEHRHLEPVVPEEGIILPTDHISVPHFRCALGIAQNRSETLRRDDIPGNRMCEKNADVSSAHRRLSLDGNIAQGCPLYYTLAK